MISRRASSWASQAPFTPSEFSVADQQVIWNLLTYSSDESNAEQGRGIFHDSLDPSFVFKSTQISTTQSVTRINPMDHPSTEISTEVPYVVDLGNTPPDHFGSSGFLGSQGSSLILLGGNETLRLDGDYNSQPSNYNGHNTNYRFGLYEWSGMGNL